MAGANWTRKDYRVVAEVLAVLRPHRELYETEDHFGGRLGEWQHTVHAFASACNDNAKFTVNGNRNFDAERFYKEATE